MDNSILSILSFTQEVEDSDIVIQECGDSVERLKGYYIILTLDARSRMKSKLMEYFPKQRSLIKEAFNSGSKQKIAQLCRTMEPSGFLNTFIKAAGGVSNLLDVGPSGYIQPDDFVEEDEEDKEEYCVNVKDEENEEEEDEEMVKELQQELKITKEKLKNLQKNYPKEGEFKDEYVDMFLDIVDRNPPEKIKEALLELLFRKNDEDNLEDVSKYISDFLDSLQNVGAEL